VRTIEEGSREIANGRVIRTEPGPGPPVAGGTTVTLYLSVGDQVRVPDIFGKPIEEARRQLEAAGLKLGPVSEQTREQLPVAQRPAFDRVPPGGVLSATPNYGTWLPRGAEIAVAIRKRQ
jgi:serine/threonine-protein kinase